MQWYSGTVRSVVQRVPVQSNTVRCFSVKELSWCAPSGSITRRSPQNSTNLQAENDDEMQNPIGKFGIVAAISACKNRVIGIDGKLPWSAPKDRKIFTELTQDSILIIGRKTLEENPDLGHIDHAKHCIVISESLKDLSDYELENGDGYPNGLELCLAKSFDEALVKARELLQKEDTQSDETISCWVAGGERVFAEALRHKWHKSLKELRLSWIHMDIPLPTDQSYARFPARYHWDNKFKEVSKTFYPATDMTPAFEHCVYQLK